MIRKHVAEVHMAERELGAWTQIHNVEIICLLAVQACLLSDSDENHPSGAHGGVSLSCEILE